MSDARVFEEVLVEERRVDLVEAPLYIYKVGHSMLVSPLRIDRRSRDPWLEACVVQRHPRHVLTTPV
jgi:hypothetical protein